MKTTHKIVSKLLLFSYFVLVLVTPILVIPYTSELFEFNKMFLVYGLTGIIVVAWLLKGIINGKLAIARSALDIPIALFFLAISLSYFVSIDTHVSIWGYYSRQHGGLLSVISFILLYYGYISNVSKQTTIRLLKFALFSGLFVAIYGILQHAGVDKHRWVQDVQRRVFSTLGQPNWLAAYMNIMLFVSLGLSLNYLKPKNLNSKINYLIFSYILPSVFFLVILYTKSRSGFLAFVMADILFWALVIYKKGSLKYRKHIVFFHLVILALSFVSGLHDTPLHRFTLPSILDKYQSSQIDETIINTGGTVLTRGGTQSSQIRKLVWQGAINASSANPLFGTGVETFAWAFYKYRPVEHNLTSEWDFLYNKAHNEYLNFLATTGYIGLGTYLLLIAVFMYVSLRRILKSASLITIGLFTAWLSILITNFFGFSVVVVSIFFWIIPAGFVGLDDEKKYIELFHKRLQNIWVKRLLMSVIVILGGLMLVYLGRYWYADTLYAKGQDLVNSGYSLEGRRKLAGAVKLRPNEPRYWSELAYAEGLLSRSAYQREEATHGAKLAAESIAFEGIARSISPNNLNLAKDSVRLLYLLSEAEPTLLDLAISELDSARELAPNDPKLLYNLALLYSSDPKYSDLVIPTLSQSIKLKSDYRDARVLLALFYMQDNKDDLAKKQLKYVLENINSKDQEAVSYLNELQE